MMIQVILSPGFKSSRLIRIRAPHVTSPHPFLTYMLILLLFHSTAPADDCRTITSKRELWIPSCSSLISCWSSFWWFRESFNVILRFNSQFQYLTFHSIIIILCIPLFLLPLPSLPLLSSSSSFLVHHDDHHSLVSSSVFVSPSFFIFGSCFSFHVSFMYSYYNTH